MTPLPIGALEAVQGALAQPVAGATGALARAGGAIGASASEAAIGAPEAAIGAPASATTAPEAANSGEGSFQSALSQALNALESSQATGEAAATEVALGTTSDPEGAVVKVQNAELEMQLASQLRAKSTEAIQTIFQTQV